MFSIRKLLLLGIAVAGIAGCQEKPGDVPALMGQSPLTPDDAMTARTWDQSKALYANGHIPAGADRFPLEASDSSVETWGWFTETPIFLANTAIAPFTMIAHAPETTVTHPSVTTPTTYTAMPAIQVIPPYGIEPGARRGSMGMSK